MVLAPVLCGLKPGHEIVEDEGGKGWGDHRIIQVCHTRQDKTHAATRKGATVEGKEMHTGHDRKSLPWRNWLYKIGALSLWPLASSSRGYILVATTGGCEPPSQMRNGDITSDFLESFVAFVFIHYKI